MVFSDKVLGLSIVVLLWLTCLFSVTWRMERLSVEGHTGPVVAVFEKGDWRV